MGGEGAVEQRTREGLCRCGRGGLGGIGEGGDWEMSRRE